VLPLLPNGSMAELGWTVSEVTRKHLQNLMSQGYMTVADLATYGVLEDHAYPALTGGYVMAF
jgi:hypothetical protein